MLAQRLQRWPDIETASRDCPVVAACRINMRGTLSCSRREGDVAQWLERLTASPVMHAFRVRSPLFPCGVFREAALFLPSQCD